MPKTLEFPRRGTCGENWGKSTTSEARERGVCSERAAPTSPAPKGEGEAGASPPAQRHSHPSRWTEVEREEREPPQTQHQVHPETPPASPAPLKGGKKKKSQGAKLPKKFPRGGRSAAWGEQRLKGDVSSCPDMNVFY